MQAGDGDALSGFDPAGHAFGIDAPARAENDLCRSRIRAVLALQRPATRQQIGGFHHQDPSTTRDINVSKSETSRAPPSSGIHAGRAKAYSHEIVRTILLLRTEETSVRASMHARIAKSCFSDQSWPRTTSALVASAWPGAGSTAIQVTVPSSTIMA